MGEQTLMKQGLDKEAILRIARAFRTLDANFDDQAFVRACTKGLEKMELKERLNHIIAQLGIYLDDDFVCVADQLQRLPDVWDRGKEGDPLRGFAAWPIIDFIPTVGLANPDLALLCLAKISYLFSAEFAIRPFIERHPALCFKTFELWVKHPDEHVRRLVSEGSRPRLPWGKQLKGFIQDPSPLMPILEALKSDESLYVRRSVANCINDISKDHPDLVLDLCTTWKDQFIGLPETEVARTDWVIKHATRSLVKQGHPKSFSLLGYSKTPKVNILSFKLNPPKVKLGETLKLYVEMDTHKANQRFVLDYVVYYKKANGGLQPKVFKLKNVTLNPDKKLKLEKTISFKPITTRRYYAGQHEIALHINGVEKSRLQFSVNK